MLLLPLKRCRRRLDTKFFMEIVEAVFPYVGQEAITLFGAVSLLFTMPAIMASAMFPAPRKAIFLFIVAIII